MIYSIRNLKSTDYPAGGGRERRPRLPHTGAVFALATGAAARAAEPATASAGEFAGIAAAWEAASSRLVAADALLALGQGGALAELARLADLSARAVSGAHDGERGRGDQDGGQRAVDEAGAPGVAE